MPQYAMMMGTAMSAYQQYQMGKEQRALHAQRAGVALEEAEAVTKATRHEAREKTKEGKRFKARQKALFAHAGVRIAGTSPLIMKETKREFARDAAFIMEGGLTEAARLRTSAGMERQMGKSAYRAGMWGAGTTLLTGAGNIGMRRYQMGK
jgi:hypothetical protein